MVEILRVACYGIAGTFVLVAVLLLVSLIREGGASILLPGLGLLVAGPVLLLGAAVIFLVGSVTLVLLAPRLRG